MLKLINKNNQGYLESGKLEILIPQVYFEHKFASIHGEFVDSFGFIMYRYYNKPSDDKPSKVNVLNVPTKVTFYPTDIIQNQSIQIHQTSEPTIYTILVFEAGNPVMLLNTIQDLSNIDLFIDDQLHNCLEISKALFLTTCEIDKGFVR